MSVFPLSATILIPPFCSLSNTAMQWLQEKYQTTIMFLPEYYAVNRISVKQKPCI